MDRLAEQVVIWHNRHPLAKRITIYDVHTIGVVALPFMRSGSAASPGGSSRNADPRGPIEPVLTEEISPESLAAAWDDEHTVAANTNAAHLDALADQEAPPGQPGKPEAGLKAWLGRLAFWRRGPGAAAASAQGGQIWPAFSERFVAGLSPKRIAKFAQKQGYSTQPGDASWPLRIVSIDDALMSRGGASSGNAWPFELFLMSAAIDAGRSRSRVLVGRGGQQAQILGRRCLSGPRVAVAALLSLSLLGFGAALWMPGLILKPHSASEPVSAEQSASAASASLAASTAASSAVAAESAASPASAGSTAASEAWAAPEAAASASTTTSAASSAVLPAVAAPALDLAASAAAQREAMAAAAAEAEAAKTKAKQTPSPEEQAEAGIDKNAPRPDIRPMIVKPIPGRSAPPLRAPAEEPAAKEADKASSDKQPGSSSSGSGSGSSKAEAKSDSTASPGGKAKASGKDARPSEAPDAKSPSTKLDSSPTAISGSSGKLEGAAAAARVTGMANKPVVALVGPVSANKAEAEATLERMRSLLAPTQSSRSPLQAQVFQTPEGYRPAVWPFASREEAQLINATLVARGMRTKAVDF